MAAPKGHPRGGGREKGTPNKRTKAVAEAAQVAAAAIVATVPDAFEGDAHALLMLIYKDPAQPIELRLEAAGKAIRFEKPALAAIDVATDGAVRHTISSEPIDRDGEAWLAKHGKPVEH